MMVTSQVKMRTGKKIDVTFAGDVCETINFWRDRAHLQANWQAGQRLIQEIERRGVRPHKARTSTNSWSWRSVASSDIIEFLTAYQEHDASRKVKTTLLAEYIAAENKRGCLHDWTVLLASGRHKSSCELGSVSVQLVVRAWHLASSKKLDREWKRELGSYQGENHYRIRRLLSPTDEHEDLTPDQYDRALHQTKKAWKESGEEGEEPTKPSGPAIRAERPAIKGLLLLYPLDGAGSPAKVESDATKIPVLGFGISFPTGDVTTASTVQYVVNNVYHQQELFAPNVSGYADG